MCVLANGQSSCEGSLAPHGSDRRFLRDESQSSHGVWGNLDLRHFFLHCSGVGVGMGWDRYRLGHPAVEVLAHAPPLNVQSGHSKVLHQGSSCAALGPHPLKGEGIRWFLLTSPTPPKSFMWEPSQATLDIGLCTSFVVERVPRQGAPALWEPKGTKRGNYRDGSGESNIRLLTGTIKADWIQLPVEQYLAALPTLKQGVIAGVFRQKGAAPWGITNAEKLQLSVFLPNELSLQDWYTGVYSLPTVWPEVSMMGADHLRKVAGYDFHDLRRKYDVRTMWGDLDPQWRLLQSQLVARGPGWYSPAELKERLFTNKSKRPGDDLKEALRTDDDTLAWQAWHVAHDLIWECCRPGPPLVFPAETELTRAMYDQIGKEEQVISPPYTRTPLDATMRGRKKRKQVEDNTLIE